MNISSINSYDIDIPDYADYNIQPTNNIVAPDPVDQVAPPKDIGAAAVVTVSAVAQENIQVQQVQEDFLYNLDELKNGNISKNEFSVFLEDTGLNNLNLEEQILNTKNEISNNINLPEVLFSISKETSNINGESKLSSFADMMDKINEETQSPDVRDKLQTYTQNLRN